MSRRPSRAWRLLLCLGPGSRVLEISDDEGERAEAVRSTGAEVVALRRTEQAAQRVRERGVEARVFGDELEQEFDAVVASVAVGTTRGTEWLATDATEPARIALGALRPGGACVLAVPNPLVGLPGVSSLLRRLRGDERVPGERRGQGYRPPGVQSLRRVVESAGGRDVEVFAPLPDSARAKFLVPLAAAPVVRYFFAHLAPRPGSAMRRAAVGIAGWMGGRGWLAPFVPELEVVATRPST